VDINGTCFFNEQCENRVLQTECRDGRCSCRFEMSPIFIPKHNKVECIAHYEPPEPETYVDPAMIMVLVGMALMFIIICVVLRLFAKARWRENRSIFNTPNPRLMNVSLLRETKPPGERRGSKGSNNRVPSRQPSMTSLRPQSPAAQSQGSRISSRGSRSSSGSVKSPTTHQQNHQPLNHDHHQQEKREDVDMQPNCMYTRSTAYSTRSCDPLTPLGKCRISFRSFSVVRRHFVSSFALYALRIIEIRLVTVLDNCACASSENTPRCH
ncbi:unnamed protein product, partial [Nesidiocoris tenuis]